MSKFMQIEDFFFFASRFEKSREEIFERMLN